MSWYVKIGIYSQNSATAVYSKGTQTCFWIWLMVLIRKASGLLQLIKLSLFYYLASFLLSIEIKIFSRPHRKNSSATCPVQQRSAKVQQKVSNSSARGQQQFRSSSARGQQQFSKRSETVQQEVSISSATVQQQFSNHLFKKIKLRSLL